jgi:hypothetical protein
MCRPFRVSLDLLRFGKVSDPPQTYVGSRLNGTDAGREGQLFGFSIARIERNEDVDRRHSPGSREIEQQQLSPGAVPLQ